MTVSANTAWRSFKLGNIGEALIGLTYDPRSVKRDGTLVLRSSNIQGARLAFEDSVYVDCSIPTRIRIRDQDILLCVRNGSRRLIGKSVMLDRRVVGQTFGAFMAVFRSDANSYLRYYFQSDDFKRQIDEHLGATINQITNGSLNSFTVYMPGPAERAEIVERLNDADDMIAALERLIAKKQAIKYGIMQRLITGKTRLPGFSAQWSRTTVGGIGEVKTGPFGSALHEADYVSDGTPIITVEHLGEYGVRAEGAPMVSESDRHRLRAYSLTPGDIVFSRVGSIDRNSLISERENGWLFSGRLLRVRLDTSSADPAFISAQFHARPFREAVRSVAVGQTMASLNTAILKGIAVDLPPLSEQKAIGKAASDLNSELGALDERLAKARAVKQGMMQELLTGRTRLPVKEAVG